VPVFTGQEIKPQARVLAVNRGLGGLRGVTLNNDLMCGMEPENALF
jgi:hypothetical protein